MKKFAGFTIEQVNAELKWVARHSTGYRFVGTYAEVAAHIAACEEDEWDYIKDVDMLCKEGQTPAMQRFAEAYEEIEKQHGWITFPELFEKFGTEAA